MVKISFQIATPTIFRGGMVLQLFFFELFYILSMTANGQMKYWNKVIL